MNLPMASDDFRVRQTGGGTDELGEVFRRLERRDAAIAAAPRVAAEGHAPLIIAAIAAEHGLTAADLTGKRRLREIVRVRNTACAVLFARGNGYSKVAAWMGGRDRTTIMHAIRQFHWHQARQAPLRATFHRYAGMDTPVPLPGGRKQ